MNIGQYTKWPFPNFIQIFISVGLFSWPVAPWWLDGKLDLVLLMQDVLICTNFTRFSDRNSRSFSKLMPASWTIFTMQMFNSGYDLKNFPLSTTSVLVYLQFLLARFSLHEHFYFCMILVPSLELILSNSNAPTHRDEWQVSSWMKSVSS